MDRGSVSRRHGIAWSPDVLTTIGLESLTPALEMAQATKAHWMELSARSLLAPHWQESERLAQLQKATFLAVRSQTMNLAGTDELDFVSLKSLRGVLKTYNPLYFVEQVSWSKHKNHETYLSLPPIFNEEVLEHVIERVFRLQELLGRSVAIENAMSLVASRQSVIEEWDFFSEIMRVTGCEFSLNLTAIWSKAKNLSQDPQGIANHYLKLQPRLIRVQGQQQQGEFFLPSSEHAVAPEFAAFADQVLLRNGADVILDVTSRWAVVQELKQSLKSFQLPPLPSMPSMMASSHEDYQRPHFVPMKELEKTQDQIDYENYQDRLLDRVSRMSSATPELLKHFVDQAPLTADVGLAIYNTQYFVQLRNCLRKQFPLLVTSAGAGFDRLLVQYLSEFPPENANPLCVGEHLEDFLREAQSLQGLPVPMEVLADVAKFEWARLELETTPLRGSVEPSALSEINDALLEKVGVNFNGHSRIVEVEFDIGKLWKGFAKGKPSPLGKQEKKYFLLYRNEDQIHHLMISRAEAKAYRFFEERHSFMKVNELMIQHKEGGMSDKGRMLQMLLEFAHRWMSLGVVEGLLFNHPDVVHFDESAWDHGLRISE
ncbi:MAG: DUF692 family multinuclear iron-containing protein [Bdellovibrionales bacterium]